MPIPFEIIIVNKIFKNLFFHFFGGWGEYRIKKIILSFWEYHQETMIQSFKIKLHCFNKNYLPIIIKKIFLLSLIFLLNVSIICRIRKKLIQFKI